MVDVLLLYGGKSSEHDVSRRSAAFVVNNLSSTKFRLSCIGIARDGQWYPQEDRALRDHASRGEPLPIATGAGAVDPMRALGSRPVVFPLLHGTFGEDGTLQGLLELAEVPFVGSATLGSAIGMDKVVSKRLAQSAGVSVVPYLVLHAAQWAEAGERRQWLEAVRAELGFPVFVKPAAQGSSVGVRRVKGPSEFGPAVEEAHRYDTKVLVEKAVRAREIEVAVMGDETRVVVTAPGEVVPRHEFYTFEAKYLDPDGARLDIPARLRPEQVLQAQEIARTVFFALDLYGLARVDLFLDQDTDQYWFNEVNTMPGFTSISQFPLLWQDAGLRPHEILERLLTLAQERFERRSKLIRGIAADPK